MDTDILIYYNSACMGSAYVHIDLESADLVQLVTGVVDGRDSPIEILYIVDLDYGILIPHETANKMRARVK